jgi:DNA-binding NtrC family response regulator
MRDLKIAIPHGLHNGSAYTGLKFADSMKNSSMTNGRPYCYLIDDDEDDRDFFEQALHGLDASIRLETIHDGQAALRHLNKKKNDAPDYIFLDLNMTPVNGKECLLQIKKMAHLADVPVIIYSNRLDEKIIYDTLQLGAFDHIEKPDDKAKLSSYLRRVLQLAA